MHLAIPLVSVLSVMLAPVRLQDELFTLTTDQPPTRQARFGDAVALGGDLNGDGVRDLIVSAANGSSGQASVANPQQYYLGIHSGLDASELQLLSMETSMASGDLTGDGFVDLVIGSQTPQDQIWIAPYIPSLFVFKPLYLLKAGNRLSYIGRNLHVIGDVDGDGNEDFLSTAVLTETFANVVRILAGPDGDRVLLDHRTQPSRYIVAASDAGDVDGDGVPDYVYGFSLGSQQARLIVRSGHDGKAIWRRKVSRMSDVSAAGDFNGDGRDDILVAMRYQNPRGAAAVYSGLAGDELYRWKGTFGRLGEAIAPAGDVNEDGYADVLVGEPWKTAAGGEQGRAHVYSGNDLFLLARPDMPQAGDTLRLIVQGGPPGRPVLLFAVSWAGQPVHQLIGGGRFRASGRWKHSSLVPPGLSGVTVGYQAFTFDPEGSSAELVDTSVAEVNYL